jgi:hypothetical protein
MGSIIEEVVEGLKVIAFFLAIAAVAAFFTITF